MSLDDPNVPHSPGFPQRQPGAAPPEPPSVNDRARALLLPVTEPPTSQDVDGDGVPAVLPGRPEPPQPPSRPVVAAAESGVVCWRCGVGNRADRAFCRNCGADLRNPPARAAPPSRRRNNRRAVVIVILAAALVLLTLSAIIAVRYVGFAPRTEAGPTGGPTKPTGGHVAPTPTDTVIPRPTVTEAVPTVGIVHVAAAVAADRAARPVATVLNTYFSAINSHDARRAFSVHDPAGEVNPSDPRQAEAFARATATTTDNDITLLSVSPDTSRSGGQRAQVTFTSSQAAGYGPRPNTDETCTRWHVTYALTAAADGRYLIRSITATHQAC
jgi:hypothetical protein